MADRYRLHHGDCLAFCKSEPANSWDCLVSDPPSSISFMSRAWDADKGGRKEWTAYWSKRFAAALRVLKPGAHGFVWALPRTSHMTGWALADAGFEIRDCISHAFGSGMPKSHNLPGGLGTALKPSHELWFLVRKPLEKGLTIAQNVAKWGTGALNIDACRVATSENPSAERRLYAPSGTGESAAESNARGAISYRGSAERYAAERPSEDLGRWPPNALLSHSAGCRRIGTREVKANPTWDTPNRDTKPSAFTGDSVSTVKHGGETEGVPAWECCDDCPVRLMDGQSGQGASTYRGGDYSTWEPGDRVFGKGLGGNRVKQHDDSGTASRFFPQFELTELDDLEPFIYLAKASRAEREAGLQHFRAAGPQPNVPNPNGVDAGILNVHPTVKSIELCRWLTRLVAPRFTDRRALVGDLCVGSGSTGVAALLEGCDFVGSELNDTEAEPFLSIATARLEHVLGYEFVPREVLRAVVAPKQASLFSRETA